MNTVPADSIFPDKIHSETATILVDPIFCDENTKLPFAWTSYDMQDLLPTVDSNNEIKRVT